MPSNFDIKFSQPPDAVLSKLLTMLVGGMCQQDFKAIILLAPAWMIPEYSRKDEAVPYEYAVKASELYRNAKLVTIHGDDHCYNMHLDRVCKAVKVFLKEVNAMSI